MISLLLISFYMAAIFIVGCVVIIIAIAHGLKKKNGTFKISDFIPDYSDIHECHFGYNCTDCPLRSGTFCSATNEAVYGDFDEYGNKKDDDDEYGYNKYGYGEYDYEQYY